MGVATGISRSLIGARAIARLLPKFTIQKNKKGNLTEHFTERSNKL
jgi:hypothetical protein